MSDFAYVTPLLSQAVEKYREGIGVSQSPVMPL